MILVADIGGTKAVLALASFRSDGIELASVRRYECAAFTSFERILDVYCPEISSVSPSSFCAAVAGPVIDNRCRVTNLPWEIDGNAVARRLGLDRAALLNDLVASGYGIDIISAPSLESIHAGGKIRTGNQALISPGTGLGETIIHTVSGRHIPIASEGGHADFAPFSGITERLWSFLRRTHPRVSVEDLLSGPGIHNIFSFLLAENGVDLNPDQKSALNSNPGAAITAWALEQKHPLAKDAINLFLDILAAEAGNLALRALPWGGVFIGGGIVPRLIPLVDKARFVNVFSDKGHHRPLLERMSICIITDINLPLYGAAAYMRDCAR